jgi:hypothetical protein
MEVIMSEKDMPEYFDAVLSVRYVTEDIVRELVASGNENPDLDDVLIHIDNLLHTEFRSTSRTFSLFDSSGEEY